MLKRLEIVRQAKRSTVLLTEAKAIFKKVKVESTEKQLD